MPVELENDDKRFWVRSGGDLVHPVPVLVVGHADPHERRASEFGDGILPPSRDLEGFYGPRADSNPGSIIIMDTTRAADGAGALAAADLVSAPATTGRRYRVLGASISRNLAAGAATGTAQINFTGSTVFYMKTGTLVQGAVAPLVPCNVPGPAVTAISCEGAALGASELVRFIVAYREEDAI